MRFITGILITGFAVYLFLAFIAYLIWWKADLSIPRTAIISGPDVEVKNWSGKSGYYLSYMMISSGFGLGAFFIPMIFGTLGLYLLKFPKIRLWSLIAKFTFATILLSLILGFIFGNADGYLYGGPGGAHGYHITNWLNAFVGKPGTSIILIFLTIFYLVFALKVPLSAFGLKLPAFLSFLKRKKKEEGTSAQKNIINETESESTSPGNRDKENIGFRIDNRTKIDDSGHYDDEILVMQPAGGSLIHDLDHDLQLRVREIGRASCRERV